MRTCKEAKEGFKKVMMDGVMLTPLEGFFKGNISGGGRGLHTCLILTARQGGFEERSCDCSWYPLDWYRDSAGLVFNKCSLD